MTPLRQSDIAVEPMPSGFSAWENLLALILRAFAPMNGVIDPPSSALSLSPEKLRGKAGAETVFLARQGSEVVGCLFAAPRGDYLYLGKLAVAPEMQGRGIGRSLIDAAEQLARRAGKAALELQTRVELAGNHEAFRRLGFVETGRTAHPGFDRPTTITMRKVLSP